VKYFAKIGNAIPTYKRIFEVVSEQVLSLAQIAKEKKQKTI